MNFIDYKEKLLQDPEVKTLYDNLEEEYSLIKAILDARIKNEMTQQELADKIGINRSDISKLENGKSNPSYNMLCRIAKGLGMKVKIEFIPENA